MEIIKPYWSKTSSVTWCEGDLHSYEYTYYIAEFYNVMSSLFIIYIAFDDLRYLSNFHLPSSLTIIPKCMIITGIGSVLFHGTQNVIGQYIDECFMIATISLCLSMLCELRGRKRIPISIIIIFILAPFFSHNTFIIIFITILLMNLIGIASLLKMYEIDKDDLYLSLTLAGTAFFFFWIPEQLFCKQGSIIDIYKFHSIWHVLFAFATRYYYHFLCRCYLSIQVMTKQNTYVV